MNIKLTILPEIVYIDDTTDITVTLYEPNGVGVNLNYIKGEAYTELGILLFRKERTEEEAVEVFYELFGTNHLPAYGTLQRTFFDVHIPDSIPEVGKKTRLIVTMEGINDNGNFARGSDECSVRRR